MKVRIKHIKKIVLAIGIACCSIVGLMIIVVLLANIFLTEQRVTHLIVSQIQTNFNATASLKVQHFSIFNGFECTNFVLQGKGQNKPIITFDRFLFRYSLLSILLGNVNIYEIGLYNPSVYLEEQRGIWNFQKILKPSKKEEEEEKKQEEEKEAQKEISMPLPLQIFFNFVLEKASIRIKSSTYFFECKNFSTFIKMHIPSLRTIPLDVSILRLFKYLDIQINPNQTLDITFISKEVSACPSLLFAFNLFYNPSQKRFASTFKAGTMNTAVRFQRSHLTPLNSKVEYDIAYDPSHDALHCNSFLIIFNKSVWMSFTGVINNVNHEPDVSFAMIDSNIRLDELYAYTKVLLGPKPYFNGALSIFPLVIKGSRKNFSIEGTIKAKKIAVVVEGFGITIPLLEIPYTLTIINPVIDASCKIKLPHFVYSIQENRSKDSAIEISCDVRYVITTSKLDIKRLSIIHRASKQTVKTIQCDIAGDLRVKEEIEGKIELEKFVVDLPALAMTLPVPLKDSVAQTPINKPITLSMKTLLYSSSGRNSLNLNAVCAIPDYSIDDLSLKALIVQFPQKQRVYINRFSIDSAKQHFALSLKGMVHVDKAMFIDIATDVMVAPEKPVVAGNFTIDGMMHSLLKVRGDLDNIKAKGIVASNNFMISNDAKKLIIGPIVMNIPIEYSMAERFTLPIDTSEIMNIGLFKPKHNFSIARVVAMHPSRNIAFEYMNNCKGNIAFTRNIVQIKDLQAFVLGGTMTVKELSFNVADLNPDNMEFRINAAFNDIDISKLDNPNAVRINPNALLSLNATIFGKDLNPEHNFNGVSGTITLYKVGEKFANRLFKGLNEEKGKSKLGMAQFGVDNSLIIKGFDFYLDKGLVYPTVFFKRKVISVLVNVKDEQVRYERIPIVEFFNKVREETI